MVPGYWLAPFHLNELPFHEISSLQNVLDLDIKTDIVRRLGIFQSAYSTLTIHERQALLVLHTIQ